MTSDQPYHLNAREAAWFQARLDSLSPEEAEALLADPAERASLADSARLAMIVEDTYDGELGEWKTTIVPAKSAAEEPSPGDSARPKTRQWILRIAIGIVVAVAIAYLSR